MNYSENLRKNKDESILEFITRVCQAKNECNLNWEDVREICNNELNVNFSESYYRKNYKGGLFGNSPLCKCNNTAVDMYDEATLEESEEVDDRELLNELRAERVRLSDERAQNNAYVRRLAREETIKDIALQAAKEMSAKKILTNYKTPTISTKRETHDAILCISDWHLGIEINNYWNVYNPEICIARVNQLEDETINYCKEHNVKQLHVVNLADLIAGRIHAQIRIQSRYDTITQIMHVSEILAEFLNDLSEHFEVHYYDCLDNHSRLEPNKNESLDIESLARITTWYLKSRLQMTHITIHDNTFGLDIINFNVRGHEIVGVHGDKDNPVTVAKKLTQHTRKQYDLVLTAHRHHFAADEDNECLIISNGTLMGTDDYATHLRLNSKPSQNLILVSDKNVAEDIHRIVLN